MILREAWDRRNKLRTEGNKIWDEANKLRTEGGKLCVEGNRIYAQAVIDFFGPEAIINWYTGEVSGKPLAIPVGELNGYKN